MPSNVESHQTASTDGHSGAQSVTVTIRTQIDRSITPNGRAHPMKKHRLQQALKDQTIQACRAADLHLGHDLAPPLTLHYLIAHGKGRRTLDQTNAIASMKYIEDGIAHVLEIDDKHFIVGSMVQTRDPDGEGFVKVAIEHAGRAACSEGQGA